MHSPVETSETPTLTKAQLSALLFDQTNLSKRESNDVVDALFDLIAKRLIEGVEVKISNFGKFQIHNKAARPGRNPRTGEAVAIDARRVVSFHPSQQLKEKLQSV